MSSPYTTYFHKRLLRLSITQWISNILISDIGQQTDVSEYSQLGIWTSIFGAKSILNNKSFQYEIEVLQLHYMEVASGTCTSNEYFMM